MRDGRRQGGSEREMGDGEESGIQEEYNKINTYVKTHPHQYADASTYRDKHFQLHIDAVVGDDVRLPDAARINPDILSPCGLCKERKKKEKEKTLSKSSRINEGRLQKFIHVYVHS